MAAAQTQPSRAGVAVHRHRAAAVHARSARRCGASTRRARTSIRSASRRGPIERRRSSRRIGRGPASDGRPRRPRAHRCRWHCSWPNRRIRRRCASTWDARSRSASGYLHLSQHLSTRRPTARLGTSVGRGRTAPIRCSFEDRLNLEPLRYYYTVVAARRRRRRNRRLRPPLAVDVTRVITAELAVARGLVRAGAQLEAGRRGAARTAPVRHRLSRPRPARAADVRRARVAVHRHRRAVLLRADRHSLRQHRRLRRRTRRLSC